MKRALIATLAVVMLPLSAHAQEGAAEAAYKPEPERRDGFCLGLSGGIGIGRYRGYPNTYEDIGNPDSEANTGVGLGNGGALWIGGALRDWLSVGAGSFGGGAGDEQMVGSGGAFGMKIDAFPLYPLGGIWRDFGLGAEFGVGAAKIFDQDQEELADGGAMSLIGVNAFLELFDFWHVAHGPTLIYRHQFSQSLTSDTLFVGWRSVIYWTLKENG